MPNTNPTQLDSLIDIAINTQKVAIVTTVTSEAETTEYPFTVNYLYTY